MSNGGSIREETSGSGISAAYLAWCKPLHGLNNKPKMNSGDTSITLKEETLISRFECTYEYTDTIFEKIVDRAFIFKSWRVWDEIV